MARTQATLKGNRCYCSACGEYFSTVSNFDRHRKDLGYGRQCGDPALVGLEIKHNFDMTYWGMPGIVIDESEIDAKNDQEALAV